MIEIHKTENLLKEGFFNFEYSKEFLTINELEGINKVKGLGLYFKDDDIESREFKHFFRSFNSFLLEEYEVYFTLIELYPKKSNRIRSKRKLFYNNQEEIGEDNIIETEVKFLDEETILTGVVKLTRNNFDYCTNHLINSLFSFGYVIKKGKELFGGEVNQTLEKIVKEFSNSTKRYQINYLKLVNSILEDQSVIYRIALDGRNNQSIELYGLEKEIKEIEEIVNNKLRKIYYLRERVNSR